MENALRGVLGFKGERGYSAYEIAVQNGFKGSEKDWLAQLGTSSHFTKDSVVHTATAEQTTFTLPENYTSDSQVEVYVEGYKIPEVKYSINAGKLILANKLDEGAIVEIVITEMSTSELPILSNMTPSVDDTTVMSSKWLFDNMPVNVKHFGAKGDGVTDDTEAIQAAIEYVEANGGVLYFNEGNYKITDELNINKSIKIYGIFEKGTTNDGTYGSQITQVTENKNIFNFAGSNNYYGVEISGLRMKGTNRGINIDTTGVFSEFIFEKIHFNGGFKECIYFNHTGTLGRISDCDFSGSEIGINAHYLLSVTLSENNFWNNSLCHIKFGATTDLRIMNNWFEKTVETGCSLLFQAPFSSYKNSFINNEFTSKNIPIIDYDMVTNIEQYGYMRNTIFENCRFACGQSDYAIKVNFVDGDTSNSHTNNLSFATFKNCLFVSVKTAAIYTDYKYLYWNLIDCECFSSWNSGNMPINNGTTAFIVSTSTRSGLKTNGVIKFDTIVDNSMFEDNVLYLSSDGTLKFYSDSYGKSVLLAYTGSSENRPTKGLVAGMFYYDTTLNKPIWYNGSFWIDATGTSV